MRHAPSAPLDDLFSLPPEVAQNDMAAEQPQDAPAARTTEQANEYARARLTDPATSHKAAERAKRFKQSHADAIAGVLWRPMIPPEIAKFTGLTVVQVDRRRKELLEAGRIKLTGNVRDGFEEWVQTTGAE